jgi:DNA-directed RNA polymerase specialized sigma24 family protein
MALNEPMAKVAESMLRDTARPLEALAQKLEFMYPNVGDEATFAVGHGIDKLINAKAGRTIQEPLKYVFACAANYMKDELTRQKRFESLDALTDDEEEERDGGRKSPLYLVESSMTPEEHLVSESVYRQLRSMVTKWETANVRETTLLYLEAAYVAEPLPSREAAELLADILNDEEVDEGFVRQWKSRGFRRLKREIQQIEAAETVENG